MSTKAFSGTFFFFLNLSYLQKLKKPWFQHNHRNQIFYIIINYSRSKQNKKSHQHPFVDIFKLEACASFQLYRTQPDWGIWRNWLYKQTSSTFYTSKDMSLRRVEKKQMIGWNNKDSSEVHTSAKLLLLTF